MAMSDMEIKIKKVFTSYNLGAVVYEQDSENKIKIIEFSPGVTTDEEIERMIKKPAGEAIDESKLSTLEFDIDCETEDLLKSILNEYGVDIPDLIAAAEEYAITEGNQENVRNWITQLFEDVKRILEEQGDNYADK